MVERLKRRNVKFLLEPVDLGWSRMMAVEDPDGNAIEILQGSEQLLKAVQAEKITWSAFTRDFKKELVLDGPVDSRNKTNKNHGQKSTLRLIKAMAREGNVTLRCHCDEDAKQCHRHILRELILSSRV